MALCRLGVSRDNKPVSRIKKCPIENLQSVLLVSFMLREKLEEFIILILLCFLSSLIAGISPYIHRPFFELFLSLRASIFTSCLSVLFSDNEVKIVFTSCMTVSCEDDNWYKFRGIVQISGQTIEGFIRTALKESTPFGPL